MVKGIAFNDKNFRRKNDDNIFDGLTKNTIILCNNYELMDSLAREICDTINGKAEYNEYCCSDEDIGKAKITLAFGLHRAIDINGQKITLSLEPSIIYKAKSIEDIWFFDWLRKDTSYEKFIYPMLVFKGSRDVWKSGKDEVYKMICNGRYGTYDGNWVDLHKNTQKEASNRDTLER